MKTFANERLTERQLSDSDTWDKLTAQYGAANFRVVTIIPTGRSQYTVIFECDDQAVSTSPTAIELSELQIIFQDFYDHGYPVSNEPPFAVKNLSSGYKRAFEELAKFFNMTLKTE